MTTEINKKALEQTAFNLCSLHGFTPEFVAHQEVFATMVLVEYLTAMEEQEESNITATIEATEQPTLRDQFAIQAMKSLLGDCADDAEFRDAATFSYMMADYMMEARK